MTIVMQHRVLWSALAAACAIGSPLYGQSNVAFAPEVYEARRAKLIEQIGEGAAIVPSGYLVGRLSWGQVKMDPNFWYLTGVESPYAVLVVTRDRTALFLPTEHQFLGGQYPTADFEAFREARWNRPGPWRFPPGPEANELTGIDETYPLGELAERLDALVGEAPAVYLPLDDRELYAPPGFAPPSTISQQMAQSIADRVNAPEVRDLAPILARLRLIKDEWEIAALRRAAEISAKAMVAAMRQVRPGMNDLEVAGLMEYVWKQEGSPRPAFEIIVKSGSRMTFFTIANEQYSATDRVMRDGELLFVDYGAAEYMTYTSDICRTFPVSGRFTEEQRMYYDIVDEARAAAIAMIKPGVMLLDAVKAAAEVFREHGLEQYEDIETMGADRVWGILPSPTHYLTRDAGMVRRVRALGHFIGLQVADPGDVTRPLEAGMVFTVEPNGAGHGKRP